MFAFRQSSRVPSRRAKRRKEKKWNPPKFNYKVGVFINRHLGIRYWQKLLTPDSKQMLLKSSAEHSHIHTAALKLGGAVQGITWGGRTAHLDAVGITCPTQVGAKQFSTGGREINHQPTMSAHCIYRNPSWGACIIWRMIAVRNILQILYPTPIFAVLKNSSLLVCEDDKMNWNLTVLMLAG